MLASHQVSAVPDDRLRTNTAVVNAYFHRSLAQALYKAEDLVRKRHYRHPLMIVTADFGCARVAKTQAINTYQSGPASCVRGAGVLASTLGHDKVLAIDVGGTTSDVSYIENGQPSGAAFRPIGGVDVIQRIPDIISYGVGGGSKIRVKDGALTVGPDSQGAVPGPAAFGLGGNMVTPTDVWLTLGLIDPDAYLGGRKKLKVDRAQATIERQIAKPLNLSIDAAALQAKAAVEETLAQHIRDGGFLAAGIDPAAVTLYAVGGGAGLLTVGVAEKLGAGAAYFPPMAAVFSAFGASTLDVVHYYEAILTAGRPLGDVQSAVADMVARAKRDMRGEGFAESVIRFSLEASSFGDGAAGLQLAPQPLSPDTLATVAQFVAAPPAGTRYLELRLTANCAMPHAPLAVAGGREASVEQARNGDRRMVTPAGTVAVALYRFDLLPIGAEIAGPLIAETEHTSILVPEERTLRIDDYGGGLVEVRA